MTWKGSIATLIPLLEIQTEQGASRQEAWGNGVVGMTYVLRSRLSKAMGLATLVTALITSSPSLRAEEEDAAKILKAMTEYVASQKFIFAAFDTDIEIVTPDLQKIQFTSSSKLRLSRPDKLGVSRTGGYADVELLFDGKLLTLNGKHLNVFAQLESPGSTDQLIERLRAELSVEAPGADLLLTNAYDELMADVIDAKYIGHGVIGGIECDHLAFRNPDSDWQIWIERGPKPVPRKYVITSKAVTGGPQYTLVIRDWHTDTTLTSEAFAFKAPAGAKKIDIRELSNIDEVPAGVVQGGRQ